MFVYVGKSFRAAATGSIIKKCTCEKCACEYQYQMVRRGEGASSAPYYINQRGAELRAQQRAQRTLAKRLEKGIDPVPCPDCGWIQAAMVREMRQRKHRWLLAPGWIALGLGVLVLAIYSIIPRYVMNSRMTEKDAVASITIAAVTALATATPFLIRWLLIRMNDPNANYPDRPDTIPGMPRAFKVGEEPDPSSGMQEVYAATLTTSGTPALQYERRPTLVSPNGWVTVQLLTIQFPPTCCSCLRPTYDAFNYKVGSSLASVPVRICRECRRRVKKTRAAWVLGTMFVLAAALAAVGYLMSSNDRDRMATAISMSIVGMLLGGLIAYLFSLPLNPVRFRGFSSKFNTIRIRFRNDAYTGSFVDANEVS